MCPVSECVDNTPPPIVRVSRRSYVYVGANGKLRKSTARILICTCVRCQAEIIVKPRDHAGHTGMCIACFRLRNEILRPYEGLYRHLARMATKRGYEVTFSFEEFVEFTKILECHYCGAPIAWASRCSPVIENGLWRTNLDRKDNNQGYSVSNCVVCCKRCNRGKQDSFSYEEWKAVGTVLSVKSLEYGISEC